MLSTVKHLNEHVELFFLKIEFKWKKITFLICSCEKFPRVINSTQMECINCIN